MARSHAAASRRDRHADARGARRAAFVGTALCIAPAAEARRSRARMTSCAPPSACALLW
jgi:hypothetical protein